MDNPLTIARLSFTGSAIVLLMYGIFFTLSIICLHYLLTNGKRNRVVLGYTVTSLLVTTIFLVASTKFTELLLIDSNIHPASIAKLLSRLDLLQQVVYSVKIWLADSLLIYRLWVIWGGDYVVTLVPCLLFTGAVGTGIAGVALFPQQIEKHAQIIKLGVGFHACSVALNVIATSLIAGRLLHQRGVIRQVGGDHGKHYLSLLAVFAESGALYSITGLVYIPLYATSSSLIYVFAALLEAASGIAPALILLRMALGVAIERKDQGPRLSTLNFRNARQPKRDSTSGTLSTVTTPTHSALSQTFDTSGSKSTYGDQEKASDDGGVLVLPKLEGIGRPRQHDMEMNNLT